MKGRERYNKGGRVGAKILEGKGGKGGKDLGGEQRS